MEAAPAPSGAAHVAPDGDGYVWIDPTYFHESFCQDCTADEGLVMAVTQKAPVGTTFGEQLTTAAWKAKPCWYQISSEDRMIHPDNQRRMAARIDPRKIITLPAGHASLASRPTEIAALVAEAAKATAA
jgi:pimeloyl-ACP methyl ester carboxylesterase